MADTNAPNKAAARRLAEDVFTRGDMDVFEELLSDDYLNHNIPVPGIPGTKDGFRQLVVATRQAFSDLVVHIENCVAEDDLVVFNDRVTATSTGDFLGVPPTGKKVEWTEIHMLRTAEGRIAEHWTNFDQFGILSQLRATAH
jgi:steroid delta-isomerase-like uncharacterized protein